MTVLWEQFSSMNNIQSSRVEGDVALQHEREAALLVRRRLPKVHRAGDVLQSAHSQLGTAPAPCRPDPSFVLMEGQSVLDACRPNVLEASLHAAHLPRCKVGAQDSSGLCMKSC